MISFGFMYVFLVHIFSVVSILGETGFIELTIMTNNIIETNQEIARLTYDVKSYPPVSYKM